jgi:hypothetical protein
MSSTRSRTGARSFRARIYAIGLTILLTIIVTLGLACLLSGDVVAALAYRFIPYHLVAWPQPQRPD